MHFKNYGIWIQINEANIFIFPNSKVLYQNHQHSSKFGFCKQNNSQPITQRFYGVNAYNEYGLMYS
jgi:hypothetical protein